MQRYLDDEPVQARPPSLAHHAAKWIRRHRPLVWSSAAVLAMAALAGGALFWTSYRRAAQLERDAGEHLAAATAFVGSGNYHAADRELADARGHLEAAGYRQGPLQEKLAELALPIAAIKRFEEFQALRQRIHSEMYALDRDILDQAQTHCRAALDLFGVFEAEPWKSQADFENLDTARQALLDEGAVELLFIWARLEMGKSDAQPASRAHRRLLPGDQGPGEDRELPPADPRSRPLDGRLLGSDRRPAGGRRGPRTSRVTATHVRDGPLPAR